MIRRHERLYRIWRAMRDRCQRKGNVHYDNYGGRGITVCVEWQDYETFKAWAYQSGYQDGLSIDRIDNDGNYEPSNCRWATVSEQCNNKRNNRIIEFNGEAHTATEWSRITGIPYRTIQSRINRDKLPPEKVFAKKHLRRDAVTGRYISVEDKLNENCFG